MMKTGKLISGTLAGLVLSAGLAFADEASDQIASSLLAQLRAQGFSSFAVETTWLGRLRVVASRGDGQREIVANPRTGEILRDVWTDTRGEAKTAILDRVGEDKGEEEDRDQEQDRDEEEDRDEGKGGSGSGGDDDSSSGSGSSGSGSSGSGSSESGGSDDDRDDDRDDDSGKDRDDDSSGGDRSGKGGGDKSDDSRDGGDDKDDGSSQD